MALTSNTWDMGTDDNLSFGNNVQSGTTFGDAGSLTCEKFLYIVIKKNHVLSLVSGNFTGPYIATACSDAENAAMNAGYDISYLLLPC